MTPQDQQRLMTDLVSKIKEENNPAKFTALVEELIKRRETQMSRLPHEMVRAESSTN